MPETRLVLGVNSCFLTRRYEEPKSWVDIIKKTGFDCMSLDSDILDPFFSGSPGYIKQYAEDLRNYAQSCGCRIVDYLTGMASYRFLGLAHKDEEQRNRMKEWFRGAIDIASYIGADCAGGRCDAYPVEALENREELRKRYGYVVEAYRELAGYAKERGLRSIYFEQMYVPSLKPYTLDEMDRYIADLNRDAGGDVVPIRPVIDVGHACGQAYGADGDDVLYEKWLERFGGACRVIHLQQTPRTKSEHGPFGPGAEGDIEIETVVECIRKSLLESRTSNWRKYLEPEEEIVLLLEAIPSTAQNEEEVLSGIADSFTYLSRAVPREGIVIRY